VWTPPKCQGAIVSSRDSGTASPCSEGVGAQLQCPDCPSPYWCRCAARNWRVRRLIHAHKSSVRPWHGSTMMDVSRAAMLTYRR